MKTGYILLLVLFFTTCAFKCYKPDDGIGGRGGEGYITLKPKQNSTSINLENCRIFVKYNATRAPISMPYDDSLTCTVYDTACYARFANLKRGDYFFHCADFNKVSSKQVAGDLQFKLTNISGDNISEIAVAE